MKVLILGAKGNLGQEFVKLYHDHEVLAWDRAELDIADEAAVKQKITEVRPRLIINCAAYNAVDKAEEEQVLANDINGYAVGYIAVVASELGATLVHFGSNYVFDGNSPEGYNEDDRPNPQSAYAKSKLLGEMELTQYLDNFYLIRTSWLYGRSSEGKKSFVDIMLEKAKEPGELKLVSDEFASPTWTRDLAQATRALVEQEKPFGVYHLVNNGSHSWHWWAEEIFTIKNLSVPTHEVSGEEFERKAKRPKYGILNNTKFIELRPWTEALREYLMS